VIVLKDGLIKDDHRQEPVRAEPERPLMPDVKTA
jgi:hypothetical protein